MWISQGGSATITWNLISALHATQKTIGKRDVLSKDRVVE
jgi:hypothetical protein